MTNIWNKILKPEINKLLKLAEDVGEKRLKLNLAYRRWRKSIKNVEKVLSNARDEISKHLRNIVIAEAFGSSFSAAGSAVAVTGFALALPTAGLSLGLTIGGMVASVLGGAAATGSSIVGKFLKKKLKKYAKREYDIFRRRCEKLQLRCNEYTESLNKLLKLSNETITPCCTKIATIDDPSLIRKYLSDDVIMKSLTQVDIMIALAGMSKRRKDERDSLQEIRKLIARDPCLSANYNQFLVADFHPTPQETTPICTSVENCLKSAKATFGFMQMGSNTPTIVARFIDMSSDVADGFSKGAAIVGRPLSIAFGSMSLGLDLILMGNAFRKLYKGAFSETLENIKDLLRIVENTKEKVLKAVLLLKLTDDEFPSSKDKKNV